MKKRLNKKGQNRGSISRLESSASILRQRTLKLGERSDDERPNPEAAEADEEGAEAEEAADAASAAPKAMATRKGLCDPGSWADVADSASEGEENDDEKSQGN